MNPPPKKKPRGELDPVWPVTAVLSLPPREPLLPASFPKACPAGNRSPGSRQPSRDLSNLQDALGRSLPAIWPRGQQASRPLNPGDDGQGRDAGLGGRAPPWGSTTDSSRPAGGLPAGLGPSLARPLGFYKADTQADRRTDTHSADPKLLPRGRERAGPLQASGHNLGNPSIQTSSSDFSP